MSPTFRRTRLPIVDEETVVIESAVFRAEIRHEHRMRLKESIAREMYVERKNTDHLPEHDDWDAGGYCNALVEDEDGCGDICGYRKSDEFEWLAADAAVLPVVTVWPRAARTGEQVPLVESVSFEPGMPAFAIGCPECGGSGWWGFGPHPDTSGPCVACKGSGRMWVGT